MTITSWLSEETGLLDSAGALGVYKNSEANHFYHSYWSSLRGLLEFVIAPISKLC